jgi:hypothetical protein
MHDDVRYLNVLQDGAIELRNVKLGHLFDHVIPLAGLATSTSKTGLDPLPETYSIPPVRGRLQSSTANFPETFQRILFAFLLRGDAKSTKGKLR